MPIAENCSVLILLFRLHQRSHKAYAYSKPIYLIHMPQTADFAYSKTVIVSQQIWNTNNQPVNCVDLFRDILVYLSNTK